MCQICTIAARHSRGPLDRTQPEPQVFNLNQFSTTIQSTIDTSARSETAAQIEGYCDLPRESSDDLAGRSLSGAKSRQ